MSDEQPAVQELVNDLNQSTAEAFETIASNGPCTSDEVAAELDVHDDYAWELCSELFRAGIVDRERRGKGVGARPYQYEAIEHVEVNDDQFLIEDGIATTDNPWRQRCPQGHASVTHFSDTYHCNACGRTYEGDPYDAKRTEFPVEGDDALPKDIHDQVLAELVHQCKDPTTEWCRAHKIGIGSPRQVGRVLAGFEDDGLVERLGSGGNKGHHWRPTDAGRQRVIEDERKAVLEAGGRQRAQAHPVAAWLLAVIVTLLLLLAYAIAANGVVA